MYAYVTFLTDFGLQDDFAGVCRGVIKRIARDVSGPIVTAGAELPVHANARAAEPDASTTTSPTGGPGESSRVR